MLASHSKPLSNMLLALCPADLIGDVSSVLWEQAVSPRRMTKPKKKPFLTLCLDWTQIDDDKRSKFTMQSKYGVIFSTNSSWIHELIRKLYIHYIVYIHIYIYIRKSTSAVEKKQIFSLFKLHLQSQHVQFEGVGGARSTLPVQRLMTASHHFKMFPQILLKRYPASHDSIWNQSVPD